MSYLLFVVILIGVSALLYWMKEVSMKELGEPLNQVCASILYMGIGCIGILVLTAPIFYEFKPIHPSDTQYEILRDDQGKVVALITDQSGFHHILKGGEKYTVLADKTFTAYHEFPWKVHKKCFRIKTKIAVDNEMLFVATNGKIVLKRGSRDNFLPEQVKELFASEIFPSSEEDEIATKQYYRLQSEEEARKFFWEKVVAWQQEHPEYGVKITRDYRCSGPRY